MGAAVRRAAPAIVGAARQAGWRRCTTVGMPPLRTLPLLVFLAVVSCTARQPAQPPAQAATDYIASVQAILSGAK